MIRLGRAEQGLIVLVFLVGFFVYFGGFCFGLCFVWFFGVFLGAGFVGLFG